MFICGLTIFGAFFLTFLTAMWGFGYLTPWQNIILPERASKVFASDALVTSSGQIYQYDPYNEFSGKNGWAKVDSILTSQYPVSLLPLEECGWIPSTKKYLESKITCAEYGPGTITKIIAIDEQGNAFYWEHPRAEAEVIFLGFAPYVGGILGFSLGILIIFGIWIVSTIKRLVKIKQMK